MQKLSHGDILSDRLSIDEMQNIERLPLVVMMNNIRSMHNVGSIFRSSDAIRLEKIFPSGYTACPPREEISKTALGSTETVDWHYFKDPIDCIDFLRYKGYRIVALEHTDSSENIYDFKWSGEKLCIIVGNEIHGVDQHVIDKCDASVEIPMHGMKHSLNVSVAFGICAFELKRKLS